jgi:hypothetical protein
MGGPSAFPGHGSRPIYGVMNTENHNPNPRKLMTISKGARLAWRYARVFILALLTPLFELKVVP